MFNITLVPHLVTIISAEIIFLLVRSSDILIMLKSLKQRTPSEQLRIDRGLTRSVVIEGIIFVPASAVLLIFLAPLLIPTHLNNTTTPVAATDALIGVVSYGFPFASVRRIMTVIALNTLREFANILPPAVAVERDVSSDGEKS
jgi:hypothetical protein